MQIHIPRLTRSVFLDQLIWMVAAGLITGVAFPKLLILLGVPSEYVSYPLFYTVSIAAGLLMGLLNFGLVHVVIRPHLHELAIGMKKIDAALRSSTQPKKESEQCIQPENCLIHIDSEDDLGVVAETFNKLVMTLKELRDLERAYQRFNESLSSSLDLQTLARTAFELLQEYRVGNAFALYAEQQGELLPIYAEGIADAEKLAKHPRLIQVFEKGREGEMQLPEGIHIEAVLLRFQPKVIMLTPVVFRGSTLGVLVTASAGLLDERARQILKLFERGIGLAMKNALAHEEIQRIAALDSLTGVFNRRFGMQRLHEEYKRAIRQDAPLGLLMLDIDHFKSINDTYGHLTGDRAIKFVCKQIRHCLREGDIVVRYGGEEFITILPGASLQDAHDVAERIRRTISESHLSDNGQLIHITISAGIVAMPECEVGSEMDMVQRADNALYLAKEGGRNQVVEAKTGATASKGG